MNPALMRKGQRTPMQMRSEEAITIVSQRVRHVNSLMLVSTRSVRRDPRRICRPRADAEWVAPTGWQPVVLLLESMLG